MKYSWKRPKDRKKSCKNRIKGSGQARLVSVKNINRNIPTTWRWARGDGDEREKIIIVIYYYYQILKYKHCIRSRDWTLYALMNDPTDSLLVKKPDPLSDSVIRLGMNSYTIRDFICPLHWVAMATDRMTGLSPTMDQGPLDGLVGGWVDGQINGWIDLVDWLTDFLLFDQNFYCPECIWNIHDWSVGFVI